MLMNGMVWYDVVARLVVVESIKRSEKLLKDRREGKKNNKEEERRSPRSGFQ
jgi:hypothetical protein